MTIALADSLYLSKHAETDVDFSLAYSQRFDDFIALSYAKRKVKYKNFQ